MPGRKPLTQVTCLAPATATTAATAATIAATAATIAATAAAIAATATTTAATAAIAGCSTTNKLPLDGTAGHQASIFTVPNNPLTLLHQWLLLLLLCWRWLRLLPAAPLSPEPP